VVWMGVREGGEFSPFFLPPRCLLHALKNRF